MRGGRMVYLGAPADVAAAISNLQDHSTSNPASICQKAALAALNMPEAFSQGMCAEFQKRRDYIVKRVGRMPNISCVVPGGAFYIFCDISKTKLDSLSFSTRFLDEKLVAVIPGVAFGDDNFIRMSYATSLSQIEKGMDRLEQFLKGL
jgi:aspartate aminotransferase